MRIINVPQATYFWVYRLPLISGGVWALKITCLWDLGERELEPAGGRSEWIGTSWGDNRGSVDCRGSSGSNYKQPESREYTWEKDNIISRCLNSTACKQCALDKIWEQQAWFFEASEHWGEVYHHGNLVVPLFGWQVSQFLGVTVCFCVSC